MLFPVEAEKASERVTVAVAERCTATCQDPSFFFRGCVLLRGKSVETIRGRSEVRSTYEESVPILTRNTDSLHFHSTNTEPTSDITLRAPNHSQSLASSIPYQSCSASELVKLPPIYQRLVP